MRGVISELHREKSQHKELGLLHTQEPRANLPAKREK